MKNLNANNAKVSAKELLRRYVNHTATEIERDLVEQWYMNLNAESRLMLSEEKLEEEERALLGGLMKRVKPVRKIKLWPRIAVAAAALTAVVVGLWFLNYKENVPVNDVAPGKNSAMITLSNGKKIILSDAQTEVVTGGKKLTYSDGSEIDPELKEVADESTYEMQTFSTPRGGTYQITLPDGTKVRLNAGSTLKYPSSFRMTPIRSVELTGEAYFEVSKNAKQPFIVRCANQKVTVLGTHFNIESYPDEAMTKTTLAEGSVRVTQNPLSPSKEETILKPGQQSQLTNGNVKVSNVDVNAVIAWTRGDFVFSEEDLTSIMKKLERWYNVEVEYRNAPEHLRFDAIISRSKNLSGILDIIQSTGKVKFKITGKKVLVTN